MADVKACFGAGAAAEPTASGSNGPAQVPAISPTMALPVLGPSSPQEALGPAGPPTVANGAPPPLGPATGGSPLPGGESSWQEISFLRTSSCTSLSSQERKIFRSKLNDSQVL